MKNNFIKIGLATGGLLALIATFTVIWPQQEAKALGTPQSLFINATNSVAGTSTNTPNSVVDCTAGKELTIGVTSQFIAAGVSNVVFYFEKSMDGVNFEPAPSLTYTFIGNGTNVIVGITNFTVQACPYVRLSHVANTSVSFPTTNTSIRVFVK